MVLEDAEKIIHEKNKSIFAFAKRFVEHAGLDVNIAVNYTSSQLEKQPDILLFFENVLSPDTLVINDILGFFEAKDDSDDMAIAYSRQIGKSPEDNLKHADLYNTVKQILENRGYKTDVSMGKLGDYVITTMASVDEFNWMAYADLISHINETINLYLGLDDGE